MIRLFFQFDLLVFIAAIELINHGGFQANNAKFNRFPNIYFHWIGKYFDWIAHSLIFKIDIIWMQLLEVGFKLFFYHKFGQAQQIGRQSVFKNDFPTLFTCSALQLVQFYLVSTWNEHAFMMPIDQWKWK